MLYFPLSHLEQAGAPRAEYSPGLHTTQPSLPEPPECLPAGHVPHPAAPCWEYLPPVQVAHALEPGSAEYLPAVHGQQEVREQENEPDGHALQDSWPDLVAILPGGQDRQEPCPLAFWYVPGLHSVQEASPDLEYLPAGHWWHCCSPVPE